MKKMQNGFDEECEFADICDDCNKECKEFIEHFNKRIEEDKRTMFGKRNHKILEIINEYMDDKK